MSREPVTSSKRYHSIACCLPLLMGGIVACGSSTSANSSATGNAGQASIGAAGASNTGGNGNASAGSAAQPATAGSAASGGNDAAGGNSTMSNAGKGGQAGTLSAAGAAGAAGSTASQAGASTGGATTGDYPYCNYGAVPSGTPETWNDSPTLTPIGLNPYGTPAVTIPGGYILINEGAMGPSQVPQDTQVAILKRINDDLKYEAAYSYIHLPPWSTGKKATHYIDYLLVGTGLPQDPNAGGDSSYEGQYPNVETTQVAMTDASQRYDLTHEFNHVLENSYGTIPGNKVSWLQESYNDYLILLTAEHANGATPGQSTQFTLPSNVAYLDALVYSQPYVPIESCGIAVKDGSSVNGPADYFTDITGFRYNDLFPLFIAQRVGQHFFAAVWEQAKTTEQVLQTMTRLLDKPRVQCLVGEYAARVALGDFVELSTSIQHIAEPTMYTATTTQGGWLVPSNPTFLPRYTGRNNVAIAVSAGATQVSVMFAPDALGSQGTNAQLQLQLAYRATDGSVVFGTPVTTGSASITLSKPAKNNVVIAVISNLTLDGYKTAKAYGWDPDETFGYKLQITGGTPAPINKLYF